MKQHSIDHGTTIDWGKTSEDYARYRPGPPLNFYAKLKAFDIGLEKQKILDLATGTGVLARQFAKQGAIVCGIDIAPEQIRMAQTLAEKEYLKIDFQVAEAEKIPYADNSFDVITANQCWLYFDKAKTIAEVRRLLRKNGVLVISHFSWLPRLDPIAKQTEDLILKHNPKWNGNDWHIDTYPPPPWSESDFRIKGMFYYNEPVSFSRETWRGRICASRGIGASLSPKAIEVFDREHDALLKKIAGNEFTVLHRLDAHIFQLKN